MHRELRIISGSLIVTLPKQVCGLYGLKDGDIFNSSVLH